MQDKIKQKKSPMQVLDKFLSTIFWCHRMPERSFFFKGKQFPICARCTGVLAGMFIGVITLIVWRKMPIWAVLICMVPMIVDGLIQNIWKIISNNPRRFITGIIFGIAEVHAMWWMLLGIFWLAGRTVIAFIIWFDIPIQSLL